MRQLKITKQVTNRESKSLDKYLQDVTKLPMITAEEEVELAQRIRQGDEVDVLLSSGDRVKSKIHRITRYSIELENSTICMF